MSMQNISEVCYSCSSCLVVKKICQLKNIPIANIHKDKCSEYSPRKMKICLICGDAVVSLAQHVSQYHNKTMSEYNIITRDKEETKTTFRRKNIWQS